MGRFSPLRRARARVHVFLCVHVRGYTYLQSVCVYNVAVRILIFAVLLVPFGVGVYLKFGTVNNGTRGVKTVLIIAGGEAKVSSHRVCVMLIEGCHSFPVS